MSHLGSSLPPGKTRYPLYRRLSLTELFINSSKDAVLRITSVSVFRIASVLVLHITPVSVLRITPVSASGQKTSHSAVCNRF